MNSYGARDCLQCAVCDKIIAGSTWFARLKHGIWMVALCCPLCTEAFESKPNAYLRRIESLAFMRSLRPTQPHSPLDS